MGNQPKSSSQVQRPTFNSVDPVCFSGHSTKENSSNTEINKNKPSFFQHVLAIIQARMTSTRLPGKVLKEVLGKPLLSYQLERLKDCKLVDQIVVATTTNETDQPIVKLCQDEKIPVFRGSEEDVLARYAQAAEQFKPPGLAVLADFAVVRVTSDCPVIDPEVVDKTIRVYQEGLQNKNPWDYVCNCIKRSYPMGLEVEVFSNKALQTAMNEAKRSEEREHVTPFLYWHPERFQLQEVFYEGPHEVDGFPVKNHRWTVDRAEDFELISRMITALYPDNKAFRLAEMLQLLSAHPDWIALNAQVSQKTLINPENL